jgi:hypothetical protein
MNILDFNAYVFDLDGVIINSEKIHYNCYKKALKDVIDYDLTWIDYCKIHHSIDNSFDIMFKNEYEKIYKCKSDYYKNEISNIELVKGFDDFFSILLKRGKCICIVTDSSHETVNSIIHKFSFLKKCSVIISREDVDKRKPDSSCYIKLIQKIINHVKLHEILVFEDSYKGWVSASNVIYNCILVNDNTYYYYEKINSKNCITNFEKILEYRFKTRFNYLPFYISSKTIHREKWIEMREYFPIVAGWIDINKNKNEINDNDKKTICDIIQNDISESDFGILYLENGEKDHIGSLIEIGLLLSNSKKIYVCGNNIFKGEVLFNFDNLFDFSYSENFDLISVFKDIQYNVNDDYNYFKENVNKKIYSKAIISKASNDILDYVVICASGKGTRLLPITKNIPKLLVNVDNENILEKIINFWKKYSKKFVIIIDSEYNIIVDFYLKLFDIQYEIINVDCNNGEENSYTLNMSLKDDKFINKKVLITWCDIFPVTTISENLFDDKNIIFTYKNYGRYDAHNNNIIKKPYGNIIGIYYISSFKKLNIFEPKMDICDCYKKNFGDFNTYEIENLVDIGDYSKLCEIVHKKNNLYNTRYFNKLIDLQNDIIQKEATCLYGEKIISYEMLFYKYHNLNNIPEIIYFGENYFKMKKILNAKPAIEVFNNCNIVEQREIMKNIINNIDKIHKVEISDISINNLLIDLRIEFYDKVLKRIENINNLLSYFNQIKTVNNKTIIRDHVYIINDIYRKIKNYYIERNAKTKYNTIHGDPHMSNILVDENNKIWFIDPRGYFGNTKLFGLKEYDMSKIIYSLSGFDEINSNNKHFFIINENQNIDVNINNNMDNYLDLFLEYDRDILLCMTILHWFGLTDYSKNNIHKCVSSYYYGIYLYHNYFL